MLSVAFVLALGAPARADQQPPTAAGSPPAETPPGVPVADADQPEPAAEAADPAAEAAELEERAAALADAARADAAKKAAKKAAKEARKAEEAAKKQKPDTDINGRVLVRNTISRYDQISPNTPGWVSDLGLDSARIAVEHKHRALGLRIKASVELTGKKAEIVDGYVRIEPADHLRIQAGRFKRPISAIALTSKWDLPAVERGLLSSFKRLNETTGEADELPLSGRAVGVQVEWRNKKAALSPRLELGVFRGVVHEQLEEALGVNRSPLTLSDGFAEDVYGRAEIEPLSGLHLALSAALIGILETAGNRDTFGHGGVVGLEAVLVRGPLSVWLEGYIGNSPIHLGTSLRAEGLFMAARAIAAVRIAVDRPKLAFIQPHGMIQLMDTSTEGDKNGGWEAGAGVNLGFTEQWRLQLQALHRELGSRIAAGDASTELIVQLGAVF